MSSQKSLYKSALQSLTKEKDPATALKYVRKALKLNESNNESILFKLYVISGAAFSALGMFDQADKSYHKAVALDYVDDKSQAWKGLLRLSEKYQQISTSALTVLKEHLYFHFHFLVHLLLHGLMH